MSAPTPEQTWAHHKNWADKQAEVQFEAHKTLTSHYRTAEQLLMQGQHFADTGKLGVAVRPRVYSDRLPKNVAQPGLEGKKLFQIGGVNPTIFNLDAALHAKITQSEYFKCLYVFKTFDKVVDLIYEKVSYVEPFTHRGASTKRSLQKQPSSAFCLLLKLFHLRLTEDQVRELLDHPDSTYLRVMGMLYVRYGTPAPGVANSFIQNSYLRT